MTLKETIIVYILLAVAFFGIGWGLHPDTKDRIKYRCPYVTEENGAKISYLEPTEEDCNGHIPTKEISILAEKKRCDEQHGELKFAPIYYAGRYQGVGIAGIFCFKSYKEGNITGVETIFSYDLSN